MNKKSFLILFFLFVFSGIYSENMFNEPQVEEGFVTFATKNYFPLLRVLLDSVHYFSTRPIVVYGVNDDIPFSYQDYPRMIKRRLDIDFKKESIFYTKPRIILESKILKGIYVEADDIIYKGVDALFEQCRLIEKYPLCPRHVSDPDNQQNIMHALGVSKKSMPYVHGHVIFSNSCMPFIREWYKTCLALHDLRPANWDETILNVLLWRYNVTKYADVFDPSYRWLDYFLAGDIPPRLYPFSNVHCYMFHGCKDPKEAHAIFERLIAINKETSC